MHQRLLRMIQTSERNSEITTENDYDPWSWKSVSFFYTTQFDFESGSKQDQALTCEKTLQNLYQYESTINKMRSAMLLDLYNMLMDDVKIFVNTKYELEQLLKIQSDPTNGFHSTISVITKTPVQA
ncbi:unnamed protein product [Rotaria magnacalcarata]